MRALAATLLAASSLTVMAGAVIAPALPAIEAHFSGASATLVHLLLTLPGLAIALSAPLAGRWCDRSGRRAPLLAGLLLYAAAGSAGLWLSALPALLASRVALGVAVALIMTATNALIADRFAGAERERFLNQQSAAMALGGVLFLIAGGWAADQSWRAPFAIYLASLLVLVGMSATAGPAPLRAAAGGSLGGIGAALLLAFAGMTGFYIVPVQVPFLIEGHGHARVVGGMAIACANLIAAVAALLRSRLLPGWSHPASAALALGLIGGGAALLALGARHEAAIWLACMVIGAGSGVVMPTMAGWIAARVAPERRGRAMGLATAAVFLGQFASPLVSAPFHAVAGAPGACLGMAALLALLVGWYARMARVQMPPSP